MTLSLPLVWSDDHRLHEPEAEIWVGVRTPAVEIPARAEAIRVALVGAGAEVVAATPPRRRGARGGARRRVARVSRHGLAGVGGRRAARRPGAEQGRAVHLSSPRAARRARAARAGRDVGAARSILLRHDDPDRARHVGGCAGRRRRRHDRRRPRLRGPERRLCMLPPARAPRDAQCVRRLLLPEQRRDRGRAPACERRRAGRHRRHRRPSRERRAADLLGARRRLHRLGARRSGSRLVSRTSSAPRPSVAAERVSARTSTCRCRPEPATPTGSAPWPRSRRRPAAAVPRSSCWHSASMRRAATPRARSTSPRRASGEAGRILGGQGIPVVVVQEGGYDLDSIGGLVLATLQGLEEGLAVNA